MDSYPHRMRDPRGTTDPSAAAPLEGRVADLVLERRRGRDGHGALATTADVGPLGGTRAPLVVALDGRSGSGKTTLARRLTRRLRDTGLTVTVLHLDNVYPGWDGLDDASALLGTRLLPRLRAGSSATYRSWSWVRGRPGPEVTVQPADVVLVEGVGCGSRACRQVTDVLVWLDAPTAVRHRRAMGRDGDGYAPHWQRWAAQEDAYLARERPAETADLVLETSSPDDVTGT
jgi:para-aminobenzoate synthetase